MAPFAVPGTAEIAAIGPLGPFPVFGVNFQRLAFGNGSTEIDIDRTGASFRDPFGPPSFVQDAYIWSCGAPNCVQEFYYPWMPPTMTIGLFISGPAEVDVTLVPEGSELAMLGITAVGILGAFKKKMAGRKARSIPQAFC